MSLDLSIEKGYDADMNMTSAGQASAGTSSGAGAARKKNRSPSYPALSLDVAIERAKLIWRREGRNAAPVGVIQEHFGYKRGTGSSNLAVAALKKYGLLEDEGSGKDRSAKLTDLAINIISAPEPHQWVQEAALKPPIHREIWEQYDGALPSDASLKHELIARRSFTETGATEFISQYRKTVAFADLRPATSGSSDEPDDDVESEHMSTVDPPTVSALGDQVQRRSSLGPALRVEQAPGARSIPILLPGGTRDVQIVGQFPMSELDWQQFMAVLTAMKPGLVASHALSEDRGEGPENRERHNLDRQGN